MASIESILINPGMTPALSRVLAALYDALSERPEVAVAARGSLATGQIDRYSDIDLGIIVRDEPARSSTFDLIERVLAEQGHVLASFRATHLEAPNLAIAFIDVGGWVVKVDAHVLLSGESLEGEKLVLHDPVGFVIDAPMEEEIDRLERFIDLDNKFTGWCWYAYSKIARGEYLEAASNLYEIRELAILPSLHFVNDLPEKGYRHLDTLLDAGDLGSLHLTYPASTARDDLLAALLAEIDLFETLRPRVAARLGADQARADLDRMRQLIRAAEARLPS